MNECIKQNKIQKIPKTKSYKLSLLDLKKIFKKFHFLAGIRNTYVVYY